MGQVFFASMFIGPFSISIMDIYNAMTNLYILGALLLIAIILLVLLAKKK